MFISGRPATMLGAGDAGWRRVVREHQVQLPAALRLRFVVDSWRRGSNRFDLDNLIDPVVNAAAWPAAGFASVWATVVVGDPVGVHIDAAAAPPPPGDAVAMVLREVRHRSIRMPGADAGLAGVPMFAGGGPLGCELALGPGLAPIRFSFESPVKPAIDALWPVLGGTSDRPDDHRIRELRVRLTDVDGIRVALWRLPE